MANPAFCAGQSVSCLLRARQALGGNTAGHKILWPNLEIYGRKDRIERQNRPVQVLVRDNNVDQALRALKKKLQREGIFREMKMRDHFEKPSVKRAREKAEAVRRGRKLARKRAQREGLLGGRAAMAAPAPRS